VNRKDTLPLQAAIGRLIAPVALSDDDIERAVYIEDFEIEDAGTWVKRFFRPVKGGG
jgi:hypothetical protein